MTSLSSRNESEPRRWTIYGPAPLGDVTTFTRVEPSLERNEVHEVMRVAEHEKWRATFSEGWKRDHAVHERLREAAQAVVDVNRYDATALGAARHRLRVALAPVDHNQQED